MPLLPYWSVVCVRAPGYPLLPGVVVNFSKLALPSYEVCSGSDEEGASEADLQVVCLLPLGTLVSVLDEKLRFFDAKCVRKSVRQARRKRRARGITAETVEEGIAMAEAYVANKEKASIVMEDVKRLISARERDGNVGRVHDGSPEKLRTSEVSPKDLTLSSEYESESS